TACFDKRDETLAIFLLKDPVDNELFSEAYDEFLEQYSICESSIVNLEHSPNDSVLLNDLFRTIHTVKANTSVLAFEPMVIMLQELETILDLVRKGKIPFSDSAGDLTLLLMDKARNFMEQYRENQQVEYNQALYTQVEEALQSLSKAEPAQVTEELLEIIALIDPNTTVSPLVPQHWLERMTEPSADLEFLYRMAQTCEQRVGYWQGRTDRVAQLALAMNLKAGNPVNPNALAASLFCHDIAMAFLPSPLLNQDSKLNERQLSLVRQHVQISSQLMRSINDSHQAGSMLMQHQEMINGSGYPNGLTSKEINAGAKIIAIVHTFEAITHGHTSVSLHKRPLMRALLEINKKAGVEFSESWVEIFMKVVRKFY
ncbi:MAG: HD domain-containing phosphohydrolase, partial [Pseudomonadales bacterium]